MDPNLLKKMNVERAERRACALVTDLDDGRDRLIKRQDADTVQGALGIALQKAFFSGKSTLCELDGRRFFINVHMPALRIIVIGAVHISQALVGIARAVDYSIEIIDPRTAFATPERFPGAILHPDWPDEYLSKHPLDHYTALIAVTHDPKIDDIPLIEALNANCLYVGALGSRKTHAKRIERLIAAGADPLKVEHIAAPIGLDIGAASPGEIATAIMAEIIQTVRKPLKAA